MILSITVTTLHLEDQARTTVRDLSVFIFQEAPILRFTHTKAAAIAIAIVVSSVAPFMAHRFMLLHLETGCFWVIKAKE